MENIPWCNCWCDEEDKIVQTAHRRSPRIAPIRGSSVSFIKRERMNPGGGINPSPAPHSSKALSPPRQRQYLQRQPIGDELLSPTRQNVETKLSNVESGPLRHRFSVESKEAGVNDLADELRRMVDWGREDLQRLLVQAHRLTPRDPLRPRLQGQDMNKLGFRQCCLRGADLRTYNLSQCDFQGAFMEDAVLEGTDLSNCNLSSACLIRADLRKANLSNAMLKDAILPAWNSGLLEGVQLTGATGWVPANKDLSNAKLQDADLQSCDLSGVNLSSADLRGANLLNVNLKGANLMKAKLQGARLPDWSSGLLDGVKLAGAEGWEPADKDLSYINLEGSDMSGCDLLGFDLRYTNLKNVKLHNTHLPWKSGLMEWVMLARAEGVVSANKDLSNAKLKGADLSFCDLSGADLSGADLREAKLEGTNLRGATLCDAILHAASGARPTTLPVPGSHGDLENELKVGKPVVFALTASRALTLRHVTLCNKCGDDDNLKKQCAKDMEVQTGPSATGPWTSVVKFTSQQTKQEQTFAAAPDAPLLAGFVQVLVHDTYGGFAYVISMALEGEAWG